MRIGGYRDAWVPGNATVTGLPSGWVAQVKSANTSGSYALASLYVGSIEAATTAYDGFLRVIQSRKRTGDQDIVTQTTYNRMSQPDSLFGPVGKPESYVYSGVEASRAAGPRLRSGGHYGEASIPRSIVASDDKVLEARSRFPATNGGFALAVVFSSGQASGKVTSSSYWTDPLGRAKQVIPPGHTSAHAVNSRYGNAGRGRFSQNDRLSKGSAKATLRVALTTPQRGHENGGRLRQRLGQECHHDVLVRCGGSGC